MVILSLGLLFVYAHTNVLSIEPPRCVAVNDTFRIKVNISDVAHFYGYNITLTFDSLVLKATQVTQGPFLRRFGSTLWNPGTIDSGHVVNIYEVLYYPSHAGFGSGTLFTVKFQVKGTGNARIRFNPLDELDTLIANNPCQMADYFGNSLPIFVFLDAWYGTQGSDKRGTFNITSGVINGQELPSGTWFSPVNKYVIMWQDKRNGSNYNIWTNQVASDGTLGSAGTVCDSLGDQTEPKIAYNPTGGLFRYALGIWTDCRRGADSADIYGRLFYNGSPVSAPEFSIVKYSGFQNNPQIARCGSRYLVIWNDVVSRDSASHTYGQLLTNQGVPIGTRIQISPATGNIYNYHFNSAVTTSDSAFLIIWSRVYCYINSRSCDLTGRLLDTLGNLGNLITITNPAPNNVFYQPSCDFDGTNYLVIWNKYDLTNNSCPLPDTIFGRFISKNGTPGSSFIIYHTQSAYDFIQCPKVNFDGANYLVVWDEKTSACIDYIKGCLVSTTGQAGTPFTLCGAPYQQAFPSGARGTSSIVVWQDYRNGTDYDIWGYLGQPIVVEENASQKLKTENQNLRVFPNPARGMAMIRYAPCTMHSAPYLKIYDVSGRLMKSFNHLSANMRGGNYESPIMWSGDDDFGRPVESGVYFAEYGNQNAKFLFLK